MQRRLGSGSVAFVALGLTLVLGCSPSTSSRSCAENAECPEGSRCASGACVANAPPSAAVAVPASPQANVLLSFDASASSDPDPGDSVVSFRWAFRALTAPCAVPVVAGTGPVANVRFACPGRYAVDVVAADGMGATATGSTEFDVAPNAGPALVTAGADLSTDHACAGTPLRCSTVQPISLSARAPGLPAEGVEFLWTVEPPADRPLSAARRVTFSPGPAAAQPGATIETDGDAISGDWIFKVEARDAAGVIGTAATRVSVLNQAPVVVGGTAPVPDHAFDGTSFTASGEVTYTVTDPDGDLLLGPAVEHRHSGDGTSTFTGDALDGPPRVTFSIVAPYAGPGGASSLIGAAGLERTIVLQVSDVNGAIDVESWPILVHDRPPTLVPVSTVQSVDHRYDAASARYLADATLGAWSDPDGDPPLFGGGSGACSSFELVGGYVVARCSASYPGAPSLSGILGTRLVSTTVGDPWTTPATAAATVEVRNRPPRILTTSTTVSVDCWIGGCCRWDSDGACAANSKTLPDGTLEVPGVLDDDDGDPLNVVVNGKPLAPCVGSSCALSDSVAQHAFCGTAADTLTWTVSASDGAATASGTLAVTRRCR